MPAYDANSAPSVKTYWFLCALKHAHASAHLVPPWMPRPVAGTKASTVVVYAAPANFSASDFLPCNMSVQISLYPHLLFF